MTDTHEAVRLADWLQAAVQTYPQVSADEPGGYCSEMDQMIDQAAALLRRIPEIEAERDQLRAELDARWQPIETAPKGQSVLLWVTRGGDRCVIDDWGDYDRHNHPRITHWMPLPAAPTPPNADQKGQ